MNNTQNPSSSRIPSRTVEYDEFQHLPRVCEIDFKLRIGDLVAIRSRGANRLARVTKVGRTRVYTEYTTESALRNAAQWGTRPVITRKSADMEDGWLRFHSRPKAQT